EGRRKKRGRVRGAGHGRSMEDEVRVILREAAAETERGGAEQLAPAASPKHKAATPSEGGPRILVIIGGGIAAYKSLDLIRRLQGRGARLRCILTAAGQHFATPLALRALTGELGVTAFVGPQ